MLGFHLRRELKHEAAREPTSDIDDSSRLCHGRRPARRRAPVTSRFALLATMMFFARRVADSPSRTFKSAGVVLTPRSMNFSPARRERDARRAQKAPGVSHGEEAVGKLCRLAGSESGNWPAFVPVDTR
jgi:hypothetical protein